MSAFPSDMKQPRAAQESLSFALTTFFPNADHYQVFLAWDTQTERNRLPPSPSPAQSAAESLGYGGGGRDTHNEQRERGPGYVALKTVASGVSSGGRGSSAAKGVSKGLFRELRALQMAGECPHIVRLLDVYPEVWHVSPFV